MRGNNGLQGRKDPAAPGGLPRRCGWVACHATLPTSGVLTLAAQGLVTCAVGAASRVAVVNQPVIAGVLALPRAAAVAGIVAAVRRKLRGEPGGVTP